MWLTILVAAAAFAAMVAMLGLSYQQIERERNGKSEAVFANAPAVKPGRCMLCNAPLPQPSTADEVVFEIEHRIDTDLQAVVAFLAHDARTAPEHFARMYQA